MVPGRLIRALLTLTAFAVVWLVASPARAEGLTSRRGAPVLLTSAAHEVSAPYDGLFSRDDRAHDESAPAPPAPVTPEHGAPLCDVRGAITFAPPPQMQETEVSLDTGVTIDDCLNGIAKRGEHSLNASNGRAPLPREISSSGDHALAATIAKLVAAPRERLPVPAACITCPASGVRSTVDRPPRH